MQTSITVNVIEYHEVTDLFACTVLNGNAGALPKVELINVKAFAQAYAFVIAYGELDLAPARVRALAMLHNTNPGAMVGRSVTVNEGA